MKKATLFFFILIFSQILVAQEQKEMPIKHTQNGFFSMDFLSVDMPFDPDFLNEPNMGMTGIHYNFSLGDFYTGLGIYGSVSGRRGGFFSLGVNAGYKKYLSSRFFLDTGFHFGGGGGASTPDGGGAFILPHANVGYDFKDLSLTAGYSYINFFDGGAIKSHQANIAVHIPLSFSYASSKNAEATYSLQKIKNSDWNQKGGKTSFMLHLNNLSVKGNSKDVRGVSLDGKTIRLAGFEFNSYLSDAWFLLLKADGAYSGIPAGYMNIILGAGHHFSFNKNRTNLLAKFGIGAGGGGGVDTRGGVLMYPDISLEQHISNNVFLSINKGFLMSPNSYFKSSTFGVGLKYYTTINGIALNAQEEQKFKGFEVSIKQDLYFKANRISTSPQDLHQISMQLNFNLNNTLYVAGQTSFANFGNAGAYAEGIVGLGLKTSPFFNESVQLFGQVLGGAAGGGSIDTGEGLIVKPSLGAYVALNDQLQLRGALGYVKASGGSLSSPFINFGLSYRLSFLSSH
jgi:hypothetical protein